MFFNCEKYVKNQIIVEVYNFKYYTFYTMNRILFSYSRFFIVFFALLSLMLSSVVFSVGNKNSIKEVVKSDSVMSDFFAVNSMSDELIKTIMETKTPKENSTRQDDSNQINKEISMAMSVSQTNYFEEEDFYKQIFSTDKIVNLSVNREVEYSLKIPFEQHLMCIVMLFGLIFMGLARSIPVMQNSMFKKLILRSASISFFYLWGIYEKF